MIFLCTGLKENVENCRQSLRGFHDRWSEGLGKHFCIDTMFDPFICINSMNYSSEFAKNIAIYHMTSHLGVK